jgi:prepilin-type N-terminal cleavage/methylation domain-containing protein
MDRRTTASRSSRSGQGFTLLEILIVFVLIAIVIAVALPLYRRSQVAANEVGAIKALRVIYQAEIQHRLLVNAYGTLEALGPAGKQLITDPALISGRRTGYQYAVTLDGDSLWHAVAKPISYAGDGYTTFYVDESGQLRGADLGGADVPGRDVASQWRTVD